MVNVWVMLLCGAASKNEDEPFVFDGECGGRNHVQRTVKRILNNWAATRLALGPNWANILRYEKCDHLV